MKLIYAYFNQIIRLLTGDFAFNMLANALSYFITFCGSVIYVRLLGKHGQTIFHKTIIHRFGNSKESINIGNRLASGFYQLEIRNNSGEKLGLGEIDVPLQDFPLLVKIRKKLG